jgi:hypothetical protein
MAEITHHPLIFTFRDSISGDGFLGGVTLSGRALMEQDEQGKWWIYGVRPGAIAESGAAPQEAFFNFRNRYKEALFDIAAESGSFDAFKAEVERFFYEEDSEEESRWEKALQAVRTCKAEPCEPFSGLPRQKPEDRPAQISVERLDLPKARFKASDNVRDNFASAA